jgi:MoaA/NifB/PqqE/SkfB family radical SAM enzyme
MAESFGYANWKWARVSIDAGNPEEYTKTRRIPEKHWNLAWKAVEKLANQRKDPEQRVGVGYVVDSTNWSGVYEGCRLAHEHGADNVRVSVAFTPQNLSRFPEGALELAGKQAQQAKLDFPGIQVNDLVSERQGNILAEKQDYQYCAAKEVLCVVGGDQKVYHCCSLAFNPLGLIGSIEKQSFRKLWESSADLFKRHDARTKCPIPCLYESRNKRALELLKMTPEQISEIASKDKAIHRNYI